MTPPSELIRAYKADAEMQLSVTPPPVEGMRVQDMKMHVYVVDFLKILELAEKGLRDG